MMLKLLQQIIRWYHRQQRQEQEMARKQALAQFIHETLPTKAEEFLDRLIIQNGTFNYFVLPDGSLPKFDAALPEIPLYMVLLTPENSAWEIAESYGVSRKAWEEAMAKRSAIKEGISEMPMGDHPVAPLFWELDWNLALDQETLFNDFRTQVRVNK